MLVPPAAIAYHQEVNQNDTPEQFYSISPYLEKSNMLQGGGQMSYKRWYSKCCCGSVIDLEDSYEVLASSSMRQMFEAWTAEHSDCLVLFHEVQKIKARRLVAGVELKRLEASQ